MLRQKSRDTGFTFLLLMLMLVFIPAPAQAEGKDPLEQAMRYNMRIDAIFRDINQQIAQIALETAQELEEIEERKEERKEAQASRSNERSEPPSGSSTQALPPLLATIRAHESGGNYSAYNGSGCEGYGCYGAYQLHGAYMGAWASRYGHPEVAGIPATQWPPSTQDDVALGLFYSTNPDGLHWCNWTDYC